MITIEYGEPKKLSAVQSAFISFPYSPAVVSIVRSLPERVWLPKEKCWEISYNLVNEFIKMLPRMVKVEIKGKPVDTLNYTDKRVEEVYSLPSELKTKLYDYQEEDFQVLMNNDRYLLLNEMGTGKGLIIIATALKRKELGQIKHCLIVCGVNTIKYTLANEVTTHTTSDVTILGNRKNRNGIWNTQGTEAKLEDLEELKTFFIITNIESLRSKAIKDKIKWHMDKGNIGMMVIDECHRGCANPSSQQGKALMLLANHVNYIVPMTGTLLKNSPLNSYAPLKMVGKEKANFSSFKSRYCVYGGWGNLCITGYKHLDELQMKIDNVSIRRLKKDVLSLPPKVYTNEYLEMGKKQSKMYSDILKMILADIDRISVSPDPLSQMIRLRQVTADTSILSSEIHESVKFDRMVELVEDAANKVLVFSNWTTVTDKAIERLKEFNPAEITGKVKDRQKQIDKFKNDPTCKVCVCTIAAAGVGLTLTEADTCIFLDEPYTSADKEQAEDRCHRVGQKMNINIITLICKGTVDEWIHRIVEKKKVMGDALVDKKYNLQDENVIKFMLTGEGEI